MANNIFGWEDEEEKREPEQPAEILELPENKWETERWSEPWEEVAVEKEYWDTPADYQQENVDETARRGGLAWSAGIVFFSSVAFMLLFGWVVDYLLQISPWGIVGGIILGSIIGFIQFFRISSQIFNPEKTESKLRPLMPRDDDEK
ncbi:MAG: hypothetical protein ACKVRN_12880 [Pyrinomonadaceae bacterium]